MKALSAGVLPGRLGVPAELCRRYTLSLPVSTLVCGIRSREELLQDLAVARDFKPLTAAELTETAEKYEEAAAEGKNEPHKGPSYGSAYHTRQHEGV